jgi:hypothetical protein
MGIESVKKQSHIYLTIFVYPSKATALDLFLTVPKCSYDPFEMCDMTVLFLFLRLVPTRSPFRIGQSK